MAFVKIKINETDIYGIEVPTDKTLNIDQWNGFIQKIVSLNRTINKGYKKVQDKEAFIPKEIEIEAEEVEANKLPDKFSFSERHRFEIQTPQKFTPVPRQIKIPEDKPIEIDNLTEKRLYEEVGLFSKLLMVKILKAYWFPPFEESERRINEIIKQYELPISSREDVRSMVFRAINKWKIVPEDCSLRRFPTPGDSDIRDLIIEE
jgi:hypothetical protein